MEELKNIKLPLGDVSLNKNLGSYYIDMRPAKTHYTSNIYGGSFDKDGVPMCGISDGTQVYLPINIAQYGFMLHSEWVETKDSKIWTQIESCIRVLENLKTENNNQAVWLHSHYEEKYKISPPWASAMAQGEIISFYLRVYQINNAKNLLDTSIRAYNFLKEDVNNGGVRKIDVNGDLWFEEYPSDPPSYVLNGFIYALFGLYDLFRVTQISEIKEDIDKCINTLIKNLHKFDAGYWSYYDLQKSELVRYYYQKNVHIPQLEILYKLTKEPIFNEYKNKWAKTLNPINYLFVKLMYRIRPRWLKILNN